MTIFSNMTYREKELVKLLWKERPKSSIERFKDELPSMPEIRNILAATTTGITSVKPIILNAYVLILSQTDRANWSSLGTSAQTLDQLYLCPKVRAHAAKVEDFLQFIITRLNTGKEFECIERIIAVGRYHTNFNVRFDAETWLVFKRALIEFAYCDQSIETSIAWRKFVARLISILKHSFNEEVCRKHSRQ